MSVIVVPTSKYNIWTGYGSGSNAGTSGILGTINKLLIDPMLQRDALAKQYTYNARLSQQAALQAQAKADADRAALQADREQYMEGVRQNPGIIPGTDKVLAYGPTLGIKSDLKDTQPFLLPTQAKDIDAQNNIVSRTINPNGATLNTTTTPVGISPKDKETLALLAQKQAADQKLAQQELALKGGLIAAQIHKLRSGGGGGGGRGGSGGSWKLIPDGRGGVAAYNPKTLEFKNTPIMSTKGGGTVDNLIKLITIKKGLTGGSNNLFGDLGIGGDSAGVKQPSYPGLDDAINYELGQLNGGYGGNNAGNGIGAIAGALGGSGGYYKVTDQQLANMLSSNNIAPSVKNMNSLVKVLPNNVVYTGKRKR